LIGNPNQKPILRKKKSSSKESPPVLSKKIRRALHRTVQGIYIITHHVYTQDLSRTHATCVHLACTYADPPPPSPRCIRSLSRCISFGFYVSSSASCSPPLLLDLRLRFPMRRRRSMSLS
jgi:hypothetical protein